jgi:dinuclear metal center YbgI/SA1388 family protein
MKLSEIIGLFEAFAPFSLQESYDNSGLQTGSPEMEITGALICLDVTEKVVDEAIEKSANLIISHHPVIFGGIKRLTGNSFVERVLISAVKNDIAILSVHTNADSVKNGVNARICDKLKVQHRKVLKPIKDHLVKLAVYVPLAFAEKVRQGIFEAGAGVIGDYDCCSYNVQGKGTFRASSSSNPFVGEPGSIHTEDEVRIETVMPKHLTSKVVGAVMENHPYEEVAYDLYPLFNSNPAIGMGMIGELETSMSERDFLFMLKEKFHADSIRYTSSSGREIRKVAVSGGSGSFLLHDAIAMGADAYVSADFKYHQFFEAEDKILIADIGHYESEQFTKELFYELVTKKFPKFAVHLSEINTNPINYL